MFFALMTILIILAFYGFYFYKLYDMKNRGIKADFLAVNKSGFVKKLELAVKVITYLIPVVQLFCIIRGKTMFPSFLRFVGLIIAAAGVALFSVSAFTMNDNWRVGVPIEDKAELVTTGVYSFSRNPAFLGFDMMYIGILLMYFSIPLYVLTAAGVAAFHFQIVNVEEDYLTAAFGENYVAYKNTVNRYLGRKAQ